MKEMRMKRKKTRRFRCSRCRARTTTIYYWDDGRFPVVCRNCKDELESGVPRIVTADDELLI